MDKVIEVASNVSTPIGLAGVSLACFFLVIREIVLRKVLPTVTTDEASHVIKLIIKKFFALAVISVVLAFIAFIAPLIGYYSALKTLPTSVNPGMQPTATLPLPTPQTQTSPTIVMATPTITSHATPVTEPNMPPSFFPQKPTQGKFATYLLTLDLPSSMTNPTILIDNKPAKIFKSVLTIVTIQVSYKEGPYDLTVLTDEKTCTKTLYIREDLRISPCL